MSIKELSVFAIDIGKGPSFYELGDIVSIRENGAPWQKRIVKSSAFVIVRVDTDLTKDQLIEQDREIYIKLSEKEKSKVRGQVAVHSINSSDKSTGPKQRNLTGVSEIVKIKEATGLIKDVVDICFKDDKGKVLMAEDFSVPIKFRRRTVLLTKAQWADGRAGNIVDIAADQIGDKRDAD